jgi:hypothetical protein
MSGSPSSGASGSVAIIPPVLPGGPTVVPNLPCALDALRRNCTVGAIGRVAGIYLVNPSTWLGPRLGQQLGGVLSIIHARSMRPAIVRSNALLCRRSCRSASDPVCPTFGHLHCGTILGMECRAAWRIR